MQKFNSAGVEIAYTDEGVGEPVLLIHGFAYNIRVNWSSTGWIKYLLEAGFRVIAFDHRGHGESDYPTDPALYSEGLTVGDMRSLALAQRYNAIIAWDSFFHLSHDDQRRMFPLFSAHAAPGAALMFTSGPEHGVAMGTLGGEPLYARGFAARHDRRGAGPGRPRHRGDGEHDRDRRQGPEDGFVHDASSGDRTGMLQGTKA